MKVLQPEKGDDIGVGGIHGDIEGASTSLVSNVLIGPSTKEEAHQVDPLQTAGVMQGCPTILIQSVYLSKTKISSY